MGNKTQQKLNKIHFHNLKNLKDLEISFDEKPLTAILGPNGCGKSTILHTISCINAPVNGQPNYRFSMFFTPTTHTQWSNSRFDVYQSYREEQNVKDNHKTSFRKDGRWEPRYVTRIERYVSYIGIKTCVPSIETETREGKIHFTTRNLEDSISQQIKEKAGQILNRNYVSYFQDTSNKKYIGVKNIDLEYSSLSMGAGEQRVFYILTEVLKSPNYGLIIIDEIDLLLHQDALMKLLRELHEIATRKRLQIIFTTHAHEILSLDFLAVRHIYQTNDKTLCLTSNTPDTLQRLTGQRVTPIEIFVEDDLAEAIIDRVCAIKRIKKYVSVKRFGAVSNCYTAVGGAILNQLDNINNMLFVLDGDEHRNDDDKMTGIKKVLTGTEASANERRNQAFEKITQFEIPKSISPEKYYHQCICNLDRNTLSEDQQEIFDIASPIQNVSDNHQYFDLVIDELGYDRNIGLNKMIELLSKTSEWDNIVRSVDKWLHEKIIENGLLST